MNFSRCVINSNNAENRSKFCLLVFFIIFIHFPHFSSFTLIFSFILSLSLSLSLSLYISFSHVSCSSTLRDLLRSLYLTMIYLHVTYTSTSQLVGSPSLAYMILPFCCIHSEGGEGVSCIMYDYETCIIITLSRAFLQCLQWTLIRQRFVLLHPQHYIHLMHPIRLSLVTY